jgi:hypothetical protein
MTRLAINRGKGSLAAPSACFLDIYLDTSPLQPILSTAGTENTLSKPYETPLNDTRRLDWLSDIERPNIQGTF